MGKKSNFQSFLLKIKGFEPKGPFGGSAATQI
jgi:hypothetical protein